MELGQVLLVWRVGGLASLETGEVFAGRTAQRRRRVGEVIWASKGGILGQQLEEETGRSRERQKTPSCFFLRRPALRHVTPGA